MEGGHTPDEERRLREHAARRGQGQTADFAGALAPVHEDFRRSGLSEDELDTLLEGALGESRAERRRRGM